MGSRSVNLFKLKYHLGVCVLLLSPSLSAGEALIAVAANFTDATRELSQRFTQTTGHKLKISYGSTGKLFAQIKYGAPYDVLLAADQQRPKKAETEGFAVTGTRFTYATGKLALWSQTPNLFTDGVTFLRVCSQQATPPPLAIANPKTAPYGLAAQQVLENLQLWPALEAKLVHGDSIAQTFQFVATGNAQAGLVAISQIRSWSGNKGSVWEIPQNLYTPITQQAVLLKKGAANPTATEFLEFLRSPQARTIILRYGYGLE